jgi:hypothetical protein
MHVPCLSSGRVVGFTWGVVGQGSRHRLAARNRIEKKFSLTYAKK